MASRSTKRKPPGKTNTSTAVDTGLSDLAHNIEDAVPVKRPRRGRKVEKIAVEPVISAVRQCSERGPSPARPARPASPAPTAVKKRLGTTFRSNKMSPRPPQFLHKETRRTVKKILDVLDEAESDEQAFIPAKHEQVEHVEDDDDILDEDDIPSEAVNNIKQDEMDGGEDYTHKRPFIAQDGQPLDLTQDGQQVLDLSTTSSNLIMVEQDPSFFEDYSKTVDQWFNEDKTREKTLIQLWEDHDALYNFRSKSYMATEGKPSIIKKFATILHVPPHIIETRMSSLRNQYQRLHRELPSGSEGPIGKTERQRELLNVLHFLRNHIKTTPSLTNYKGKAPMPHSNIQDEEVAGPSKSTPKKRKKAQVPDPNLSYICDDDEADVHDFESDSQDVGLADTSRSTTDDYIIPNVNRLSRNARLHNPKAVQASIRRSPRLSPIASGKKTSNPQQCKGYKKKIAATQPDDSSSGTETTPVSKKGKAAPGPKRALAKKTDVAAPISERSAVVTPKKGKKINCADKGSKKKAVPSGPQLEFTLTAAHRKLLYEKQVKQKAVEDDRRRREESNMPPQAPVNAAQRKAHMMTAEQRAAMLKEENVKRRAVVAVDEHVEGDVPWNQRQGGGYRKKSDGDKKGKEKEAAEQMAGLMKRKADALDKLTAEIGKPGPDILATGALKLSAEQLWADGLVPQLRRMSQDTRDEFMVHVMSLAFKAIRGQWP